MSSHLRGRVRLGGRLKNGRRWWIFEVVNTTTGEVVHSDNTCGLTVCCDGARENVLVARTAWVMGLGRRALRLRWTAS